MDKKLLKPYMRQFYKGNGWRFALALVVTLVLTASTMMETSCNCFWKVRGSTYERKRPL